MANYLPHYFDYGDIIDMDFTYSCNNNLGDDEDKTEYLRQLGLITHEQIEDVYNARNRRLLLRESSLFAVDCQNSSKRKRKGAKVARITPSPPDSRSSSSTPDNLQLDTVCDTCQGKGAKDFCEGCGVTYHKACIDMKKDKTPWWACPKCISMGVYSPGYFSHDEKLLYREKFKIKHEMLAERGRIVYKLNCLKESTANTTPCTKSEELLKEKISQLNKEIDTISKSIFLIGNGPDINYKKWLCAL